MGSRAFLRDGRIAIEAAQLTVDGRPVPVVLTRNARARRIILRFDRAGTGLKITLPRRATRESALAFAETQKGWIEQRLKRAAPRVAFAAGGSVPLRGEMHLVCHRPQQRGPVLPAWVGGQSALFVAGSETHLARRLRDWLKSEARRDLGVACRRHASAMDVGFHKLAVRDQMSRWGSCSASGVLSFSWRLILAPPQVLDYVAVHEVAHLAEMNHGPAFWRLVERHSPGWRAARLWLRQHGAALHCYG
jgi:predicted metal-dependent hydrolase